MKMLKQPLEKLTGLLTGLAFVLILSQTTRPAMAYFTTYTIARGGYIVQYKTTSTEIREDFEDWVKVISIENTGNADCFVRVKVFAGSQFALDYVDASGKWSLGDDGYWYYADILPAGGLSEPLRAEITFPKDLGSSFNVVVIQESVPVSYREDGTPYADWSQSVRKEAAAE